jgi:hypothetical protein
MNCLDRDLGRDFLTFVRIHCLTLDLGGFWDLWIALSFVLYVDH